MNLVATLYLISGASVLQPSWVELGTPVARANDCEDVERRLRSRLSAQLVASRFAATLTRSEVNIVRVQGRTFGAEVLYRGRATSVTHWPATLALCAAGRTFIIGSSSISELLSAVRALGVKPVLAEPDSLLSYARTLAAWTDPNTLMRVVFRDSIEIGVVGDRVLAQLVRELEDVPWLADRVSRSTDHIGVAITMISKSVEPYPSWELYRFAAVLSLDGDLEAWAVSLVCTSAQFDLSTADQTTSECTRVLASGKE